MEVHQHAKGGTGLVVSAVNQFAVAPAFDGSFDGVYIGSAQCFEFVCEDDFQSLEGFYYDFVNRLLHGIRCCGTTSGRLRWQ